MIAKQVGNVQFAYEKGALAGLKGLDKSSNDLQQDKQHAMQQGNWLI